MENPLAQSRLLIILTIVYNIVEGIIALYFGFQTNSTSLLGFGFDSTIEITASIIALWGISGAQKNEKISERLIAYSFLLLIVFIVTKSMFDLINLNKPEASIYGILIAILSIIVEGPETTLRNLIEERKVKRDFIFFAMVEIIACFCV